MLTLEGGSDNLRLLAAPGLWRSFSRRCVKRYWCFAWHDACGCGWSRLARTRPGQSWGRMSVAVTFRHETENERREHEYGHSFFHGSEAESLPHFNELETPVLFDHECAENFASIRDLARRGLLRRQAISSALVLFAAIGSGATDNVA
jgi:hypothetical protein